MIRISRQRDVRATCERWFLHGVVQIVTHPLPKWQACPDWFVVATAPLRSERKGGGSTAATRQLDPPMRTHQRLSA